VNIVSDMTIQAGIPGSRMQGNTICSSPWIHNSNASEALPLNVFIGFDQWWTACELKFNIYGLNKLKEWILTYWKENWRRGKPYETNKTKCLESIKIIYCILYLLQNRLLYSLFFQFYLVMNKLYYLETITFDHIFHY
jgi:hypothetical protein